MLKVHPAVLITALIVAVLCPFAMVYFDDDEDGFRPPSTPEEHRVAAVAARYVAVHYPNTSALSRKPAIMERRGAWQVRWPLPPHMVGGSPLITIEQETHRVLHATRTQ